MKIIFITPEAVRSFVKIAACSWAELIEFEMPAPAQSMGLLHDLITLETNRRVCPVIVDIPTALTGPAREVAVSVWELTDDQAKRHGVVRVQADQLHIGE